MQYFETKWSGLRSSGFQIVCLTMAHKTSVEALNTALQGIRNSRSLVGGDTVLMAEAFRQTLPVVPLGTRADEINASLKTSLCGRNLQF